MHRLNIVEFGFVLLALIVTILPGCRPSIKSFKVTLDGTNEVRRVTTDDTLRIQWEVKGKPTLLIHRDQLTDSTIKILDLTLAVRRAGKDSSRFVQVEIVPDTSNTTIAFKTEPADNGKSIVAAGVKNPAVSGNRFQIITISNPSGRKLIITHANKTVTLSKEETPITDFADTPLEGSWSFKYFLTEAEKSDHSTLPDRLQINATVKHKRR